MKYNRNSITIQNMIRSGEFNPPDRATILNNMNLSPEMREHMEKNMPPEEDMFYDGAHPTVETTVVTYDPNLDKHDVQVTTRNLISEDDRYDPNERIAIVSPQQQIERVQLNQMYNNNMMNNGVYGYCASVGTYLPYYISNPFPLHMQPPKIVERMENMALYGNYNAMRTGQPVYNPAVHGNHNPYAANMLANRMMGPNYNQPIYNQQPMQPMYNQQPMYNPTPIPEYGQGNAVAPQGIKAMQLRNEQAMQNNQIQTNYSPPEIVNYDGYNVVSNEELYARPQRLTPTPYQATQADTNSPSVIDAMNKIDEMKNQLDQIALQHTVLTETQQKEIHNELYKVNSYTGETNFVNENAKLDYSKYINTNDPYYLQSLEMIQAQEKRIRDKADIHKHLRQLTCDYLGLEATEDSLNYYDPDYQREKTAREAREYQEGLEAYKEKTKIKVSVVKTTITYDENGEEIDRTEKILKAPAGVHHFLAPPKIEYIPPHLGVPNVSQTYIRQQQNIAKWNADYDKFREDYPDDMGWNEFIGACRHIRLQRQTSMAVNEYNDRYNPETFRSRLLNDRARLTSINSKENLKYIVNGDADINKHKYYHNGMMVEDYQANKQTDQPPMNKPTLNLSGINEDALNKMSATPNSNGTTSYKMTEVELKGTAFGDFNSQEEYEKHTGISIQQDANGKKVLNITVPERLRKTREEMEQTQMANVQSVSNPNIDNSQHSETQSIPINPNKDIHYKDGATLRTVEALQTPNDNRTQSQIAQELGFQNIEFEVEDDRECRFEKYATTFCKKGNK